MAYNEELEHRISSALEVFPKAIQNEMKKKKMFGGLAFLFHNKMMVGVVKEDLMVRVVAEKMEDVLAEEFVRPMDFTNRPMKEFIFVSSEGFQTETQLHRWLELGLEHAQKALSK